MADDENKKETKKANKKPANVLLRDCLLIILFAWICNGAAIYLINEYIEKGISKSYSEERQKISEMAVNVFNERFANLNQSLQSLTHHQALKTALTNKDSEALTAIAQQLSSTIEKTERLMFLPWGNTATADLDKEALALNNVELMLISKAGNGKASIDIHKSKDKHLISQSVFFKGSDNNIIGIALLQTDINYFKNSLQNSLKSNIGLSLKSAKKILLTIGSNHSNSKSFNTAIDGLTLNIAVPAKEDLSNKFFNVYLSLTLFTVMFSLLMFAFYFLTKQLLNQDIESVKQFTEGLKGLHAPQKPLLKIPTFNAVLDTFLSVHNINSSAVNEASNNDNKKTQSTEAPKSDALPDCEVKEIANFTSTHIFKQYDLRGDASKDFTKENCKLIGQAIGSHIKNHSSINNIAIGYDSRESSPKIANTLKESICSTGCNVIMLGEVITPMVYFAAHTLENCPSALMITGSHNGDDQNGIKILIDQKPFFGQHLTMLLERIQQANFTEGEGTSSEHDIKSSYIEKLQQSLPTKALNILLDDRFDLPKQLMVRALAKSECNIIYSQNKAASNPEQIEHLQKAVQQQDIDIAIAFDSDADRLIAIAPNGNIIAADQLAILFASEILNKKPESTIVHDVKCSKNLTKMIEQSGGTAIMHAAGHSNIKHKMQQSNAVFGVEFSGHFYFADDWFGFDDGLYAALRLLNVLSQYEQNTNDLLATLPPSFSSPEYYIEVINQDQQQQLIEQIKSTFAKQDVNLIDIDGIRVEFDAGWGLLRASNTEMAITLRFEAKTESLLAQIQGLFKSALKQTEIPLDIPF